LNTVVVFVFFSCYNVDLRDALPFNINDASHYNMAVLIWIRSIISACVPGHCFENSAP